MFNKIFERYSKITFLLALTVLSGAASPVLPQTGRSVLPARYDEHRFFVEPVLDSGEKIVFYTDTGGGLFIYKGEAENLKLIEAGKEIKSIDLPKFKEGFSIPAPLGSGGKLFVFPKPKDAPNLNAHGMLGQQWFADRIWTFDYPKRQLILWDKTPKVVEKKSKHKVQLGFKTDESGKRVLHFPRIQVEIDGEVLELLFDTGATTFLTDEALKSLSDGGNSSRATSFITNATFEKWRKKHPNWRVIEKAESGSGEAMIEVPKIKIAGYEVGPVWFTRRADKNFHEFMSKFMDKQVEGAIGGNALRHFRVTVDYPKAIAVFEKK